MYQDCFFWLDRVVTMSFGLRCSYFLHCISIRNLPGHIIKAKTKHRAEADDELSEVHLTISRNCTLKCQWTRFGASSVGSVSQESHRIILKERLPTVERGHSSSNPVAAYTYSHSTVRQTTTTTTTEPSETFCYCMQERQNVVAPRSDRIDSLRIAD